MTKSSLYEQGSVYDLLLITPFVFNPFEILKGFGAGSAEPAPFIKKLCSYAEPAPFTAAITTAFGEALQNMLSGI